MSYQAIVCAITVRPHPNADKLKLGTVAGHQVIVDLDTLNGELGVFFPTDGRLSPDMCHYNNLYRIKSDGSNPPNIDPNVNGYLEPNGRVRTIKLRGAISEGLWLPLHTLEWTGADLSKLVAGDQFDTLNGKEVCRKYYTRATIQAMKKQRQGKNKKSRRNYSPRTNMFFQHRDTTKLRYAIDAIPNGSILTFTEKLHGTSGRTGQFLCEMPLTRWQRWWNHWIGRHLGRVYKPVLQWLRLSGSRKVVLRADGTQANPYYQGTNFRQVIHENLRVRKGETLYYEIVGYSDTGSALMGSHGLDNKDPVLKSVRRAYGDHIVFSYGCDIQTEPCSPPLTAQQKFGNWYEIYVYRITHTTVDGHQHELSWPQIKARCAELGLKHVPEFGNFSFVVYDNTMTVDQQDIAEAADCSHLNKEMLQYLCERLSRGNSALDTRHFREGVVVRVDAPDGRTWWLKYKGFVFCHLEGIKKNTEDYVDLEEIS